MQLRIVLNVLRLGYFWAVFLSNTAYCLERVSSQHVQISWVAPSVFESNVSQTIGIKFQIDPDWHIYWKNSGDSGAPPKFNFKGGNYSVGPIQWPLPKRISVGTLVNLGYEAETVFLFDVKPKDPKSIHIPLKLEWLVCKEECIPGIVELDLDRAVGVSAKWSTQQLNTIQKFKKQLQDRSSGWGIQFIKKTDSELTLKVVASNGESTKNPELFPVNGEVVKPQSPKLEIVNKEYFYTFGINPGQSLPSTMPFLVVDNGVGWEQNLNIPPLSLDLKIESIESSGENYFVLIFFAFLGGIVLNLMPCVLPVLSFKFLSILKSSESSRRKEAVLYTAGVLVTFFSLGAAFLILRSAGAAIGWGFQLQSPYIIFFLILLFWLMSLNFFGFFEFGDSVTNFTGRFHSAGSFSTGILAVFVAAPCTGPFMGTALGAAAVLPAFQALLIFLFLGFGLAFPFLIVSYIPSLYRIMPKPGAWMDSLKQFLAFPLLATVIWLGWVLSHQIGIDGWLLTACALLFATLSIWLWSGHSKIIKTAAGVLFIGVLGYSVLSIGRLQENQMKSKGSELPVSKSEWVPFSSEEIAKAKLRGQFVFVDFTASWCVTCQVNKKAVLETESALKLFTAHNVLLMRADWTNQDPIITKALEQLNRSSVPVYLFYKKDGSFEILPQILTMSSIENLFNKKE